MTEPERRKVININRGKDDLAELDDLLRRFNMRIQYWYLREGRRQDRKLVKQLRKFPMEGRPAVLDLLRKVKNRIEYWALEEHRPEDVELLGRFSAMIRGEVYEPGDDLHGTVYPAHRRRARWWGWW